MQLLPSLAQKIIGEVKKLLNEDLIIVNREGIILASTDPSRISRFHEGAVLCMKEKRNVVISKEDEKTLIGVKAGLNLPVFFQQEVIGVIGITGEPEHVLPFGEIIRKMTELLIQENYYSEQLQMESRMQEAFVFDWLQLKEWPPAFFSRAKHLNIELEIGRRAVLAELRGKKTIFQQDLWQLRPFLEEMDLVVQWGNERLLLLIDSRLSRESFEEKLTGMKRYIEENWQSAVSIGAGQNKEPHGIRESFEQAEKALHIALRTHSVIFEEDLRLDICLDAIPSEPKKEFTKRVLGPVLKNEELLETCRMYFSHHLSVKETAEALHLHVNTLHYRFSKLKELTGVDIKHFPDTVELYLACYFLE